MNYRIRIADTILKRKLQGSGAVLIEGPKWCGKTTTAEQQAASVIYMDDPRSRKSNIEAATLDPNIILNGETPRLIDEWQLAPQLWDAVRYNVDHSGEDGQYILTGSAMPLIDEEELKRTHTGTGRISRVKMRPMSLWESGDSNGSISLQKLFKGEEQSSKNDMELRDIAYLLCRGGWPRAIGQDKDIALDRAIDYYEAVINYDITRALPSVKNKNIAERFMRSYARFQGSQAPLTAICADMTANNEHTIDIRTVQNYLNALRQIFVIEDMPAWNPNLRSKTAIRTSDTRYFVDPSIAIAALGLGPDDLMNDLNTFGFMFESLCVRDLRIYSEVLGGSLYHFRDNKGLECDAVIHLRNGNYGLIEIKLGGDKLIEEGAVNLLKLSSRIDTTRMKAPAFNAIVTAVGKFAFRRSDGIYIIPITTLRP